ncbi:MAG: hypothetical protein FJ012_01625 [Chloroflexi bacterium]|nr:hypothetical protein [Chloroflexota bacterium]
MQSSDGQSLEQALAKTEADVVVTLKAADAIVRSLRRFRTAAKVGNLRELRSSVEAVEKGMAALRQQFANAKEGWTFDEESYFAGGLYSREIVAVGRQMDVSIFERDDRLYCYPVLIKISSSDKAVFVDKKRETRIRPSVLVSRLRELQRKPPLFRPEAFLEALYKAYSKAVAMRGKELLQMAPVIPLVDIYDLLTLLPGQAKEYTKQEFARDIYLLHRSGVDSTKGGAKVRFPSSTGTKTPSRTIGVITETGEEKRYYGISFIKGSKE